MNNAYQKIIEEIEKGAPLVLGTLIKTKGSTPQVPGASAIFNAEGLLYGTLGGGIVEAKAQKLAETAIRSHRHCLEEFNLNAGINDKEGAICGGSARLLIDADPGKSLDIFIRIKDSLESGIPGVLITVIRNDKDVSLSRFWFSRNESIPCDFYEEYQLGWEELSDTMLSDKPRILTTVPDNEVEDQCETIIFVEPVYPDPELVIVGAGHVGRALCQLGTFIGFKVTVLDNRSELAVADKLPGANRILVDDIDRGFKKIAIHANTYLVIVTKDHREDAEALKYCIKSDAAYIGMIGSSRKIELIREKFISDGIATPEEFGKVYAPVGIDIHSETVNEIAVSIAAQLIDVRNSRRQVGPEPAVWCIVLAAGESKRMKQQKLLMPYKQKTIIETVVEKSLESRAGKVLVVLGSDKDAVLGKISHTGALTVINNNYRQGMLSSVQCGINSVPADVSAVVVVLGDQPMVRTEVINSLINRYKGDKGILIPTYNGMRGHPILLDMKFRKEINKLDSGTGLRALIAAHPEEISEQEVMTDEILKDIDTPEDYKKQLIYLD